MTRLDYVEWDETSEEKQQGIKKLFSALEEEIEYNLGPSREKSLALTKLEECWMWVGKSIKVDQVYRINSVLEPKIVDKNP